MIAAPGLASAVLHSEGRACTDHLHPFQSMNTVPLQFLIGVTRLVAIYFGLNALEGIAAAIAQYATVRFHASSALVQQMPVEWGMYVPGLVCSLILAIGTWFAAPFLCRLALFAKETPSAQPDTTIAWNEVMIFLTGALFVGWGLTRLEDALIPILKIKAQGLNKDLAMVEQIWFFHNGGHHRIRRDHDVTLCEHPSLDAETQSSGQFTG